MTFRIKAAPRKAPVPSPAALPSAALRDAAPPGTSALSGSLPSPPGRIEYEVYPTTHDKLLELAQEQGLTDIEYLHGLISAAYRLRQKTGEPILMERNEEEDE